MKLFIISDTHGKLDKVYEIYERLTAIDLIVHLGDLTQDAKEIEKTLGVDVLSVKGNMDGSYNSTDHHILETECGKLFLAHGHMENVKSNYQNMYYRAMEAGCVAALFGHTHIPVFDQVNGIYLINPGSLSLPADGTQGSYAIVHTDSEGLSGSIVYYSAIQKNKPPKVQGGYLRGLLNYSDRF